MRNPHRPTLADRAEQRRESHNRGRGVYRETEFRLRGISPTDQESDWEWAHNPTYPRRGMLLLNMRTGEMYYINGEIAGPALDVAAMCEEREKAEERARALLMRFLSPEQRDTWEAGGHFFTTSSTGRTWRISIDACCLMDGDRPQALYCYVPEDNLPKYDAVLARKLMIEHHEEKVTKDGNLLMDYTEYTDVGGGMYVRRDDQGFTYTPHTQPITRTITRGIDEYAEYAIIGHRITEA